MAVDEDKSTLEYLDGEGNVKSFSFVPWSKLHGWLSGINGDKRHANLPRNVNRGKILEELDARRKQIAPLVIDGLLNLAGRNRGYGKDWRDHEDGDSGLTHMEELLVFQPDSWKIQAREYLFRYGCEVDRTCASPVNHNRNKSIISSIAMVTPIEIVLLHPQIKRSQRYEPLNLLLAYGASNPFPRLEMQLGDKFKDMLDLISPAEYFVEFSSKVSSYDIDGLRKIGQASGFSRLSLLSELDCSTIIGQRLAKQMIRQKIVHYANSNKHSRRGNSFESSESQPLSLIFAGPSGNGKTELAILVSRLLNTPTMQDLFLKIDCTQLRDATELFGLAGAYQGAHSGSALNNFVVMMSSKPKNVGVVLLDEIEKADKSVVKGLYQVIDKGEWTNKRLEDNNKNQTSVISCRNIIFIMTTNACRSVIEDYAKNHKEDIYLSHEEVFVDAGRNLESLRFVDLFSIHIPLLRRLLVVWEESFPFFLWHVTMSTSWKSPKSLYSWMKC